MIYCPVIGMSDSLKLSAGQTYYAIPRCPWPGCRYRDCRHHIEPEDGKYYDLPPKNLVLAAAQRMIKEYLEIDSVEPIDIHIKNVYDQEMGYSKKQPKTEIPNPSLPGKEVQQTEVSRQISLANAKEIAREALAKAEAAKTKTTELEAVKMESITGRTLDIGIIGVGGAGNHIADAFGKQKYDVMAINLTDRDYSHLQYIPNDQDSRVELIVGAGGAGKNPDVGAQAIKEYTNTLVKKIQRKFNNKEFIFVTYGLGGGTGTIGGTLVAEIAASLNIPVGVIITLPRKNEGTDEKVNCLRGLQEVNNFKGIKSIVVIDNQRVMERLQSTSADLFWGQANDEIVNLFDRFNRMSSVATNTAFDAEDYKKCLNTPGFLVLGSSEVSVSKLNTSPEEQLKTAVAAIHSGLLADGFNHQSAIRAAGLITRPSTYNYAHTFEESLFSYLKGEIGAGGLNRGIYQSDSLKDTIVIDTLIAGMKLPEQRIKELVQETKQEAEVMSSKIQERMKETISLDIPSSASLISGTPSTSANGSLSSSASLLLRKRG